MASNKNRGLGKGLEALFGDSELDTQEISVEKEKSRDINGIVFVNINDIKPNANQPRKMFDEEKLNELAESIEAHGLIQPVIVRKAERGYEIVAGERRWRACRIARLKEIPCIVRELTDEQNMLIAIIENMQREDLNPIEEAEGLNQMADTFGLTQEQISKSVGKSRPYITNALRLLKLPEIIKEMVSSAVISAGHARAIIGIEDTNKQIEIAQKVAKEGITVREIEKLIKEANGKKTKPTRRAAKNADTKKAEEDLKDILGTKVLLNQKGKKGKIEIEYYTKEDLERLLELLKTLR